MARDKDKPCELDQEKYNADDNVKIICLGDSAVGKSKLMERFLMDGFQPQQLSTYALTLYKHRATVDGKTVLVGELHRAKPHRLQREEQGWEGGRPQAQIRSGRCPQRAREAGRLGGGPRVPFQHTSLCEEMTDVV
uniref:Uncharacterized protein n=1 Tax=Sus scrofa TaxID=9823 RepID=A0A287BH71_PIG